MVGDGYTTTVEAEQPSDSLVTDVADSDETP